MTINDIKHQILSLTFREDIDYVTFRYLLMHLLVKSANGYGEISHTQKGFAMLQNHRKLETICATLKDGYRENAITHAQAFHAKHFAIGLIQELTSYNAQKSAA